MRSVCTIFSPFLHYTNFFFINQKLRNYVFIVGLSNINMTTRHKSNDEKIINTIRNQLWDN